MANKSQLCHKIEHSADKISRIQNSAFKQDNNIHKNVVQEIRWSDEYQRYRVALILQNIILYQN